MMVVVTFKIYGDDDDDDDEEEEMLSTKISLEEE